MFCIKVEIGQAFPVNNLCKNSLRLQSILALALRSETNLGLFGYSDRNC